VQTRECVCMYVDCQQLEVSSTGKSDFTATNVIRVLFMSKCTPHLNMHTEHALILFAICMHSTPYRPMIFQPLVYSIYGLNIETVNGMLHMGIAACVNSVSKLT